MNGDRPNSSTITGIENLFVFGEMIVDGVTDACGENNGVSVQYLSVVSFVTVVAVETV